MQTRQSEKFVNSNRHYSLRKLSVGLASVLIGISFLNGTKTTVKADTITASTRTGKVSKAGNLEVAGDSKDLSAFSMSFNGKNGENETAKADVTSDQTTQTTNVQGQTATTQPQNEKKQASSAQNSVADQSQNNLLDDLGKQKASTENNQAEAKNQENRLVDQINYKLTNNTSTDNKEDLGQNLTALDETKQTSTIKSDAEKSTAQSSSVQKINNQSNNHADDSSQSQNEQKLDITKNSKLLDEKALATNLTETNSSPMINGGFDEATWGKLDVNDWQGSAQDGVYQLTNYNGDLSHVIVPNEADFEKAGKSTNGLQVGITRDTINSIFSETDQEQSTIAFSKTNNKKVKAIGTDWSNAFSVSGDKVRLSKFDGSNLDVSNVTNMSRMFTDTSIGDLTSLANWDTSNVTNMSYMFTDASISDLTPLKYWDTSSVTTMKGMFGDKFFNDNSISDLTPLKYWDTSKVTDMSEMFAQNSISNLTGLANWKTGNVTDMSEMFAQNSISNLTGLANWDTSNVTDMNWMFSYNSINDLTPLANWKTGKVKHESHVFRQ